MHYHGTNKTTKKAPKTRKFVWQELGRKTSHICGKGYGGLHRVQRERRRNDPTLPTRGKSGQEKEHETRWRLIRTGRTSYTRIPPPIGRHICTPCFFIAGKNLILPREFALILVQILAENWGFGNCPETWPTILIKKKTRTEKLAAYREEKWKL